VVSYEERVEVFNRQIGELLDAAATKLFENTETQDKIFDRLRKSREAMQLLEETEDKEVTLSRVEFELRSVSSELLKYEQLEREDLWLRKSVPVIILFYLILVVLLMYFSRTLPEDAKIPLVGVPLSVAAWAGLGSIAAILFRFYKMQTARLKDEVRWMIAGPVIGIIMGALGYLAIKVGLIVVSSGGPNSPATDPRVEIMWIVAFLGGFSDRFFETVIGSLSDRFLPSVETRDGPRG
jgi:hypothetical protein